MGGVGGERVVVRAAERRDLLAMSRSTVLPETIVRRAAVLLLAADGVANAAIARQVGVSRPTVIAWRRRWTAAGMAGLADAPRSGRPHRVAPSDLLAATLRPPAGSGTWTTRSLGLALGVGHATVARTWQEHGLSRVRAGRVRFDTVPVLEASGARLVGLHLDERHRVALLAVDGPEAERVLRRVSEPSPDHGALALTTVQPPGALDVREALAVGLGDGVKTTDDADDDADADDGAGAAVAAFLDAAGRTRSNLLADAHLHLVVQDAATLRDRAVRDALALQQPRLTTHLATRPWTWPGMVATWVLMGDRRPGAAWAEPASAAALLAALRSPATSRPGWSLTWTCAARESVRRAPQHSLAGGPGVRAGLLS